MKSESPPIYPTIVVLSTLFCVLSWQIEVVLIFCELFFGKIPVNNPAAHYVLLAVAVASLLFVRFIGRHHFRNVAHLRGRIHLSTLQAVLVTMIVIVYPLVTMWALGVFGD